MNIQQFIQQIVSDLYCREVPSSMIQLQKTKKDFKGHLTLIVFPLLKLSGKKPEQTAKEIGEHLLNQQSGISGFNVVKGFLNLIIAPTYWIRLFNDIYSSESYGM